MHEKFYVKNLNDSFEFYSTADNSPLKKALIPQKDNIDTVNRVEFGKKILAEYQNEMTGQDIGSI